jgi:hypothetical protein
LPIRREVSSRYLSGASRRLIHPNHLVFIDETWAASQWHHREGCSSSTLKVLTDAVERVPSGAARRYLLRWSETIASAEAGVRECRLRSPEHVRKAGN